jgi:RND family efflux transporter MFP subunit
MTTMPKEAKDRVAPAAGNRASSAPTSKRGPGIITLLVVLAVCAGLAYGIYMGIHSRVQAEGRLVQVAQASAIPSVKVVHPVAGSAASEIALPGNTQAFTDTPIYARTSGYLKGWDADIGAHVAKGQLLAEIETPELDQQLQQAQADLKNAQANLNISKTTSGRYEALLKSNSVSKEETDQAMSDLQSKQALVDSSAANVRRLQQLQDYEKIYAPFAGVITARNTDIGHLIQAGNGTDARELFHLAATDPLRVYIPVPEVYAASVKSGDKVAITIDSYPGEAFTGTIVRNSDSIDLTTRTLNVEVDVANPNGHLLPGAYAFVHLKVPPHAGAVTIPSNTLLFRSEGLRVGVVRDGRVELTPITIGHDYGSSVEVVKGLTTDDEIILDPSDSLADGAKVQAEVAAAKPTTP